MKMTRLVVPPELTSGTCGAVSGGFLNANGPLNKRQRTTAAQIGLGLSLVK